MITPTYTPKPDGERVVFCNVCGSLIYAYLVDAHTRWHRSLEDAQTSVSSSFARKKIK